jgi:murein tripeptide amidase MpaA
VTSYYNVSEVDTAVVNLSTTYTATSTLITLPTPTVGGRTCHALRLGAGTVGSRDVVLLTGGVHAREWGGCEILVNFAADLLKAYQGNTGITYGGKSSRPTR